jgi:ubiquitin conjugation factor E4 B
VIQWLTDALLVNAKADAIEKDTTKISSEELLYNLSVVLLKLCDPFVSKPEKAALIDPGFVTSPTSHGGVYDLAGDNALTRLGDNISHSGDAYNPKNSFIPLCFFFCSRALALSIVPSMASYERMASHVNNTGWRIRQANGDIYTDRRFNRLLQFQCAMGIVVKSPTYASDVFRFYNAVAGFLLRLDSDQLKTMPEHMVSDACAVLDFASGHTVGLLSGIDFGNSFRLTVKLLSKDCAKLVRNYNLRASLGDILHNIFLPREDSSRRNQIPESVICDPLSGGRPYLVSDKMCQDTLAPSLLLLYGEVETTGFYEKSQHRVKIAALLKYLWDSPEHKTAFRKIAEDQESFITFANGIINDMNDKFAGIMEKLPAIRTVQLQMANPQEWAAISEEERETILERHEENERGVENTLSLCDTVLKMLGFLNTDKAIRDMFLLPDMCPRLANMLLFVLTKLVGSRGLDLKVDNPEKYNFRPKEMLQNVCVVFSSFADAGTFQAACAKSGYYTPDLLSKSVKTCRKLGLLVGESMELFEKLEGKVEEVAKSLGDDEEIYEDAPDEFLDPLMSEFMIDPVILPTSNTVVDRATIQQHLLNDPTDPFNRKPLSIDDVVPAEELKEKMKVWLDAKRSAKGQN